MSIEMGRNRPGLNESEAAMAWAFARFGGNPEACHVLESDAGGDLKEVVDSLDEVDETGRQRLQEAWRRQDRRTDSLQKRCFRLDEQALIRRAGRLSGRWRGVIDRLVDPQAAGSYPWQDTSVRTQRAIAWIALGRLRDHALVERVELHTHDGFGLDRLLDMSPDERDEWIRQLGVFFMAQITRNQDRRDLARLRRALHRDDRQCFDAWLQVDREVDPIERGRLRELFLSISRQEPDLTVRLVHLGMFSVAASAGKRFARRLRQVAAQLPETIETLLLYYHRLSFRGTGPSLAPAIRRSLDEFVDARRRRPASNALAEENSHE